MFATRAVLYASRSIPRQATQQSTSQTGLKALFGGDVPESLAGSKQSKSDLRRQVKKRDIGHQAEGTLKGKTVGVEDAKNEKKLPLFKYSGRFDGKPKTPGTRFLMMPYSPWLWNGEPFAPLTVPKRKKGGRSSVTGQIVQRSIGGGAKQRLRKIDFFRRTVGLADVIRIEYCPRRTAHIALIKYRGTGVDEKTGKDKGTLHGWSYILATDGMRAGDTVWSLKDGVPEGLVPDWDVILQNYAAAKEKTDAEAKVQRKLEEETRQWGVNRSESDFNPYPVEEEVEEVETAPLIENGEEVDGEVSTTTSDNTPAPIEALTTTSSSSSTEISTSSRIPINTLNLPSQMTSTSPILSPLVRPGSLLPLSYIPSGTQISSIALTPGGPGQLCRAAGTSGRIMAHHAQGPESWMRPYTAVQLASGEIRRVDSRCTAVIGMISNKLHQHRSLGKAGRSRKLGLRPHVRGVAMNSCDHPHGGGRGKSQSNKISVSIWGWMTKGQRTRKPVWKNGNKAVIQERPRGKLMATKIKPLAW